MIEEQTRKHKTTLMLTARATRALATTSMLTGKSQSELVNAAILAHCKIELEARRRGELRRKSFKPAVGRGLDLLEKAISE